MNHVVCCPHCETRARVSAAALGLTVNCPNCDLPYRATELPDVPTVYSPPKADADFEPTADEPPSAQGHPTLFGLALLPFLIPLLWLLGPLLTGKEAVFTVALPIGLAVSASGLCFGLVLTQDWSFATRVKGICAIVVVAFVATAGLYFTKTEWLEVLRQKLAFGEDQWQRFQPPKKEYTARVPTRPTPDARPMVTGFDLETYRAEDTTKAFETHFLLAHGRPPRDVGQLDEVEFFAAVKKRAAEAVNGTLATETPVRHQKQPGIEFVINLPDQTTLRVLRVVRVGGAGGLMYVIGVEGPFLKPDMPVVKRFFDQFDLTRRK